MRGYIYYRLRQTWTALALVAIAWLARTLLDPVLGERLPYGFFLIAAIVAAWTVDIQSTALTVVLGWCVANWFFESPRNSLTINGLGHWLTSLTYLVTGLAVVWFAKSEQAADLRELAALAEARRGRISEANYRRLFDQAPVGLAELEIQTGRVLRANARLCQLLGWDIQDISQKQFRDLTSQGEIETICQELREAKKTGGNALCRHILVPQSDRNPSAVALQFSLVQKSDSGQTLLLAAAELPQPAIVS